MKQTLTLELIMNPGFSGVASMNYDQELAEQRWLSMVMLFIASNQQLQFERVYLGNINEMTELCLS